MAFYKRMHCFGYSVVHKLSRLVLDGTYHHHPRLHPRLLRLPLHPDRTLPPLEHMGWIRHDSIFNLKVRQEQKKPPHLLPHLLR